MCPGPFLYGLTTSIALKNEEWVVWKVQAGFVVFTLLM